LQACITAATGACAIATDGCAPCCASALALVLLVMAAPCTTIDTGSDLYNIELNWLVSRSDNYAKNEARESVSNWRNQLDHKTCQHKRRVELRYIALGMAKAKLKSS
jgi:hypothetical protein